VGDFILRGKSEGLRDLEALRDERFRIAAFGQAKDGGPTPKLR
jgi:hypothetical protein